MSEHETDKQPTAVTGRNEESGVRPIEKSEKSKASHAAVAPTKSKAGMYIAAIVIVVATLLVVLFMLEKEGRSSTGLFDSYLTSQADSAVVAVVNGEEITEKDLNTSIQQFNQAAIAQGVDTSDPEVAANIRAQALEVLVNTALLKQAAHAEEIEVSDEVAAERMEAIQAEIGGEEVLQERIAELGLSKEDLKEDIKEEILIQTLLDGIFAEAGIVITDEEIQAVYDSAGGAEAGLPPLEEVRDQIEAQVRGTKEQEVIEAYLASLKTDAEIELI